MVQQNTPDMPDAHAYAEEIAREGGVLMLPGVPLQRQLVGELRWLGTQSLFWFPAFADDIRDARTLNFDSVEKHAAGVCFWRGKDIIAALTPIDKCGADDLDDFRVGWKIWQDLRPLRTTLIQRAADFAVAEPANVRADRAASTLFASL